jgi:hypothetical protein
MSRNTITCGEHNFKVTDKNRPFSNDFVMRHAKIVKFVDDKDEICCLVDCTEDSQEPGRAYVVHYSFEGMLLECCTIN